MDRIYPLNFAAAQIGRAFGVGHANDTERLERDPKKTPSDWAEITLIHRSGSPIKARSISWE